ncbi:MAG TPA: SGNH/GDSL hydrolase family protein [Bryobacteraceae bacterium]|jgi:lysophospholipase L1-like esterase
MRGRPSFAVVVAALAALTTLSAQSRPDRWVTTWTTAQELVAPTGPPRPARQKGPEASNLPPSLADQTVRMVAHVSLGGRRLRVELSNMLNAQPLEIGAAHLAIAKVGGEIAGGTGRILTFGGSATFTIPPGVVAVTDPVDLEVAPLADLAVSVYLPHDTGVPASHTVGLHTGYISKGNVAGSRSMLEPTALFAYAWLAGIDVAASSGAYTIVALGDSITDGFATTRDANLAWPALLAKRLKENQSTQQVAVVNQGISGNQVLRDGAGISALARLDRDVLTRPGVKWVILFEGINDINLRTRPGGANPLTTEELIGGYRQIIERCHAQGIQVMGATLTPSLGVPTYSDHGEEIRVAANRWIREKGNFDAVVDFEAVLRDPQHPAKLRPELDPGDHIHPNDAGNQMMADAFDLQIFKK